MRSDPSNMSPIVVQLQQVESRLAAGEPRQAIELLPKQATTDPWIENARGVCLMRLGQHEAAIALFRGLVLHEGSMFLRQDRPTGFATNFATALLLGGNLRGCISVLHDLNAVGDATSARLEHLIERWKRSLGWWERLRFSSYGMVARPVELDHAPGQIVFPPQESPQRVA
jgi:hypothetical protein